jgi:hypothetical protein
VRWGALLFNFHKHTPMLPPSQTDQHARLLLPSPPPN